MASVEICRLLSLYSPRFPKNIKTLSEHIRLTPQETAEVVAYAFFRAFPVGYFAQINAAIPKVLTPHYRQEVQLSMAVFQSLAGKSHVKNHEPYQDVRKHQTMQTFLDRHTYASTQKMSVLVEECTKRALRSLPAPYHQGLLLKFSPKTLELCKALEAERETLTQKLYKREVCSPFELLPIYNRAAIFIPTDSKDKWISWGMIVQLFHASVPSRREEVTLGDFPLSDFTHLLKCPIPNPGVLPNQSFHEFVVRMTLYSIQNTLGFPLPEPVLEQMSESFMQDEALRKDLSFYVVYLDKFVDDPIPEGNPERTHLFVSFRILYNLMETHIPPEYRNQKSMTEIAHWVFMSTRKSVICLDKPDFPRPHTAEEVTFSFQPDVFVDRIHALQRLYTKNGEEFLPNALSLLTIFPKEPFIRFILRCNEPSFAQITTRQVLDLSHNDGIDFAVAERVFEGVVKSLPPGLEGMAPTFFDMMTDAKADENGWPPQIERFNKLLSLKEHETLSTDLYFKMLHLFLKGKILPEHFAMFALFNVEMTANQRLDLIYRATHQHEKPPLETDPPRLHRALFLLKPQKMECIRAAMALHKVEGPKLVQYLACQPLSPLPAEIDEEHHAFVRGYLVELNARHTFTDEQQLHLFYEFLCLQEKRQVLYQNIQLIHLIEHFIGHSLDTHAVYIFLCYHPDISKKDVQAIFDDLMQARIQLMTSEMERPIVNPVLMSRIVEKLAELQYEVMDNERMREFATAHELVSAMIGNLQFHLSAAIAFPFITHLLRGFPDTIPVQERGVGVPADRPMHFGAHSPCDALIPISLELNIHKDMHSSWEEYEGGYLYRFSLVSDTETFSGSAFLPFNRELLIQNPMLLSVIKDLCNFLCLDTYWDFHNREELDYEKVKDQINNLKSLLAFNLKAKRVWEAFEHPHKEAFEPGVFAFVVALKTQHRQALLNTATHGRKHHQSPLRLEPQTFPKLASCGNLFCVKQTHSLLPSKLLPPHSALFPFYCSLPEVEKLDASLWEHAHSHENLTDLKGPSLLVTENNHQSLHLPLLIHSHPRRVEYHYKVQVFEKGEVVNLVDELDDFEFDGTEIILQTEYKEKLVQVVVTFPDTKVATKEAFTHWMSWQIALLKSRVYERIIRQASL